jgi:hypothetical protein
MATPTLMTLRSQTARRIAVIVSPMTQPSFIRNPVA